MAFSLPSASAAAGIVVFTLLAAPPAAQAADIGYIEIEESLLHRPSPGGMLFGLEPDPTLLDVITALEAAAADPELEGLVIRLRTAALTSGQIDEISAAMQEVREAGKTVHLFTEIYGPAELRLGANADEIIMQKGGAVSLPGLYMEEMYLGGTLDWLGVDFQRVMIGDYKGAGETLALSEPSPAWEENISRLLDGMYAVHMGQIARGRGMSMQELEEAMEVCFYAPAERAIEVGLIDAAVDRLRLEEHLQEQYGEPINWQLELGPLGGAETSVADMGFFEVFGAMMAMFSGQAMQTEPTRETIAILHIDGAIVDGESSPGGFMSGQTVGSLTIREALKQLEDNDLIRGVIVRIDSPGGSAIASESIWIGLRRLAEKKPVWASVNTMAASGGYYIAVGCDKIYVNPTSIVGSIGVVGGKFVMGGLYDKIDANIVPRSRGPIGSMMSSARHWNEEEVEKIRVVMHDVYEQFVDRVKATREDINIAKTAEGRLFIGAAALELEMADEVGGIDAAIEDLAAEFELAGGEFDVLHYPAPPSFEEVLEQALPFAKADAEGMVMLTALREMLGEQGFAQFRSAFGAFLQLREEPVIVASPRVMIFR